MAVPRNQFRPGGALHAPAESVIVLSLDPVLPEQAWRTLGALGANPGAPELIFVCRASALIGATAPDGIKVIPLPEATPTGERDARRIGIEHSSGDVVRFFSLADLTAIWEALPDEAPDWASRLAARNVVRPDPPPANGRP